MTKTQIFKSLFVAALPFLIFAIPVTAAEMSDWEWNDFNVQFSLPDTMKVIKNTADTFEATNDSVEFDIYPWKDESETAEHIAKEAFATLSTELGIDPKTVKKTDGGSLKINGFDAYLMEGSGQSKNGGRIYAVVGLIDPDSSVNFAAYVDMWSDDADTALQEAVSILKSIKKIKK